MPARALRILGLALLLACSGCGAGEDDGVDRRKAGDVLGDYSLEAASDFQVGTSEFRSRVLLIHFFEAGSDECRAAVAQIRSLWFPHRAAGMSVLGVCPETDREEVLRTAKEWALPYPVFLDPDRRFMREFAPREYPWNVVVGRDGTLLLTEKGSWDRVQDAVNQAIRVKVTGPEHVRVQHVLIAFDGSVPGKEIGRSRERAAKLAAEILGFARSGEEFGKLAREYSADAAPGVYRLANFNVQTDDLLKEAERGTVVQSFGDVAFSLEVGQIGLAEYHPLKSPHGWDVVKRLE